MERKRMMRLFWPVFVEQSVAVLITIWSTVMVRSVSGAAMAGVGMLSTLSFLVVGLFVALSTGATVAVGHALARREFARSGDIAAHMTVTTFYLAAALGALLLIFRPFMLLALFGRAEPDVLDAAREYYFWFCLSMPAQAVFSILAGVMRAAANVRMPMAASVLSNFVYLGAGAAFIYGAGLGVAGAGAALVLSKLAPAALLGFWFYRGAAGVVLPRLSPRPKLDALRPALAVAVPASLDSLIFNGGKVVVQVFMAGMGTAVLEANAICNSLCSFMQLPAATLQVLCVAVVAGSFGAGEFARAQRQSFQLTGLGMAFQAVMSAVFFAALPPLLGLFSPSDATAHVARQVMTLAMLCTPLFWAASFIMPQMLRAAGDAPYTMWVSMSSMALLRVFSAWLLGVHFALGLWGIWLAMILDWIVRGGFFTLRASSLARRNVTAVLQTGQTS